MHRQREPLDDEVLRRHPRVILTPHAAFYSVEGFLEISVDVTERHAKRAELEAALRANDALLRTLNMHAIVSIADRDGVTALQHARDRGFTELTALLSD